MGLLRFFLILWLATGLAYAQDKLYDSGNGTVSDPRAGLMWVADGNFAVDMGLARDVIMTRAEAEKVVAAMNAGLVENFGYTDWRVPTPSELRRFVQQREIGLTKVRGLNPEILGKTAREEGAESTLPASAAKANDGDNIIIIPVRGGGSTGIANIVVFATNSIQLKQNAAILSGDVVANDASDGPTLAGNEELTVGVGADTPAGFAVFADSIKLKNNAIVAGDAHYNDLNNNGTINGTEFTPLVLPVLAELPPFITASPGGEIGKPVDIFVGQGEFLVLAPGNYGIIDVNQNGEILFTGGIYDVEEIDSGLSTRLSFDEASEIRVNGKFAVDKNSYVGPADGSGLNASDIIFYVNGINGNNGNFGATPRAAKIGIASDFFANIYVPNGTLHLRQNSNSMGSFWARDVLVGDGADVTLDSFYSNQSPIANDDAASVPIGGTVSVLTSNQTSVLANDSDPEGGILTVDTTPFAGPSHGTLTLNADGTFSYTHDGSNNLSDSFDYRVCDNDSPQKCSVATVSISVIPNIVTITVTKTGLGSGRVTTTPEGIDCGTVCSAPFATTQAIFLEARADPGSVFTGWSGDPDCLDGQLSPNGDKNCTANFDIDDPPPPPDTIDVSITLAGTGSGVVSSNPAGIDCGEVCTAPFPQFRRIELTPLADAGSVFAGWSGDLDCLDGLLNGNVNTSCTATFNLEAPPPDMFTVRMQVLGSGSGTVSSNPIGLFCTDDCTIMFEADSKVTFFARPDPGSVFTGWGGDCSGQVFSTSLTVNADKDCTATFDTPQ